MTYLDHISDRFRKGLSFDATEAESIVDSLISETDEPVLAKLFTTWNKKGIEENEIYSIARIMRERMTTVNSKHETFVDIVGTGGSRSKTFNVSTAAAFVVAGAGVPVAKHGNKAATSNSGSADVLSELGVEPAVDAKTAERCLNEIGICFMFAPNFHRLSPTLGKVRRSLGFPTIFNCVGPLCNPALARHQLIGVWDKTLVPKMASALARLGTTRSWIVSGKDGLDEISLGGPTYVAEVEYDDVRSFEITPDYFGFETASTLQLTSRDASHSAEMIRSVLTGKPHAQQAEDIVLINACAALHLVNVDKQRLDTTALARETLQNGNAHKKLEELSAATLK